MEIAVCVIVMELAVAFTQHSCTFDSISLSLSFSLSLTLPLARYRSLSVFRWRCLCVGPCCWCLRLCLCWIYLYVHCQFSGFAVPLNSQAIFWPLPSFHFCFWHLCQCSRSNGDNNISCVCCQFLFLTRAIVAQISKQKIIFCAKNKTTTNTKWAFNWYKHTHSFSITLASMDRKRTIRKNSPNKPPSPTHSLTHSHNKMLKKNDNK